MEGLQVPERAKGGRESSTESMLAESGGVHRAIVYMDLGFIQAFPRGSTHS